MGREGVSAPIFGATRLEQLEEAIEATDVELDAPNRQVAGSRLQAALAPDGTTLKAKRLLELGSIHVDLVTHRGIRVAGLFDDPGGRDRGIAHDVLDRPSNCSGTSPFPSP